MADPKIIIRRSATPNKVPTENQLALGELAINTYDGKLYLEQDQTSTGLGVTVIAVNPWGVGVGSTSYNTYFTSGNVGLGLTNPTQRLDIDGGIRIRGALYDSNNVVGAAGSILISTGIGVSWTTPSAGGSGAQGAQGFQGDIGAQGFTGAQGDVGSQGSTGAQGDVGSQGAQGFQGDVGAQGAQGFQGDVGAQGFQGDVGSQGSTGAQGDVGSQGSTGAQGDVGSQGAQGFQGDVGSQGSTGAQGDVGSQGSTGAQGDVGSQGSTGAQGDIGAQGAQGPAGVGSGESYWISTSVGIHTLSNVGVGTTNPTSALTVSGNGYFTGSVTASTFVGDGSGLTGIVATGTGVEIRDNDFPVGTAATINFGSNLSVIFGSGIATVTGSAESYWASTPVGIHTLSNVGIGVTNPTSKLTIDGSSKITGILTVGTASYLNQNLNNGTIIAERVIGVNAISLPLGDYGIIGASVVDAFGISLFGFFDCLIEPMGTLSVVDLGSV